MRAVRRAIEAPRPAHQSCRPSSDRLLGASTTLGWEMDEEAVNVTGGWGEK